ncbi:hypothetical protein ACIBVL_16170 [Streptomyces sp. NPDC049687]|uniref:hypothetical protein n=1 Tax=Streptomyces sp. NPDC049687 TaxID=3365596 RepID=UPI0037914D75
MTTPKAFRRQARLIDHAAPPTPQEWLEHDARYFDDVEAEIQRRAAGGAPDAAPWASPLYFGTSHGDESAPGRLLLTLRHLSGEAIARLVLLGRVLHKESTRPEGAPAAEAYEDTGTVSPATPVGRAMVGPSASAKALAG